MAEKERKEKKEWYYLDKDEVEQGPFAFSEMQAWWMGGYPYITSPHLLSPCYLYPHSLFFPLSLSLLSLPSVE